VQETFPVVQHQAGKMASITEKKMKEMEAEMDR
jgi:hypothetical protein